MRERWFGGLNLVFARCDEVRSWFLARSFGCSILRRRDERDGRVKLYIVFPRVDRAEENKTFEYGTSIVDV